MQDVRPIYEFRFPDGETYYAYQSDLSWRGGILDNLSGIPLKGNLIKMMSDRPVEVEHIHIDEDDGLTWVPQPCVIEVMENLWALEDTKRAKLDRENNKKLAKVMTCVRTAGHPSVMPISDLVGATKKVTVTPENWPFIRAIMASCKNSNPISLWIIRAILNMLHQEFQDSFEAVFQCTSASRDTWQLHLVSHDAKNDHTKTFMSLCNSDFNTNNAKYAEFLTLLGRKQLLKTVELLRSFMTDELISSVSCSDASYDSSYFNIETDARLYFINYYQPSRGGRWYDCD